MRVRGVGGLRWVVVAAGVTLTVTACGGDTEEPGDREVSPTVVTESSEPSTSSPTTTSSLSLTPVPKALDGDAVEEAVRSVLTGSYGIADVESVRCPQQPAVIEGATFDCIAIIADESKRIPIKIVDEEGRYEVGLPV